MPFMQDSTSKKVLAVLSLILIIAKNDYLCKRID
jgi:hypothetical protein